MIRRAQILLDVARVVVVGHVDFQAAEKLDAMAVKLEIERILYFQVETANVGKRPASLRCPT